MISDMNKKVMLKDIEKRIDYSLDAMNDYRDIGDNDSYLYYKTRYEVLQGIMMDCVSGECPETRMDIIVELSELYYEKSRLERMIRALDTEIEEQIEFYREELEI